MADTGSDTPHNDAGAGGTPARVSPPVLQAEDFNHEALAHLQVQSDEIFLHVQLFIDRGSERNRRQLVEYLKRFRNTLVLIDKIAAVYVVEELLTLMQTDASGRIANRSELARVLATAAEQLCEYVATLQQDTRVDSALPLLPLVNDSRACREETLLSDAVVLAAGIELPAAKQASLSDSDWINERQRWVEFASSHHSSYARALLGWWRSGEFEAIRPLVRVLGQFAKMCNEHSYLEVIAPLFQSATIVARAIEERELDDGPALRSMFAQLERNVHRCSLVATPDDLLPGDLLRNYLYYVAQTESSSRSALDLRRQFRLDRIREAALVNQSSMTPTIGVGYHLATAIRAGIANEMAPLYTWLKQSASAVEKPKLIRLSVRLIQLEPVLSLMGEPQALACLQQVNQQLQQLQADTAADEHRKLDLLRSLQNLDELLDKSARLSITRGAGAVDRATIDGEDVFVDMATDALLRESRSSLRIAADDLALLFVNPETDTVNCVSIVRHLNQINNALQILPLPEINALICGLGEVLHRASLKGQLGRDLTAAALINNESPISLPSSNSENDRFEADTIEQEIARLLISIDFYLGCVLQPQPAASQLLVEAKDALDSAYSRVDGAFNSTDGRSEIEQPVSILSLQDLLSPMERLGKSLDAYRNNPESSSIIEMQLALADYRQVSARDPDSPHWQLATSAESWLENIATSSSELTSNQFCAMEEVHALIPQLLDDAAGGVESVSAFDELIQQFENGAAENRSADDPSFVDLASVDLSTEIPDSAVDAVTDEILLDPWSLDYTEPDISSLTLNIDDELLQVPDASSHEQSMDNTLQHVFYSECLGHLESLEESVRNALQPRTDDSNRLPNEQMLRALHTLTSSAQTVDAPEILAIVQPLQRAALTSQRLEQTFDASQTRYIGDLTMALRARLDCFKNGVDVGLSVKAVEQKLDGFLESILPGNADPDAVEDSVNGQVSSLEDVFTEEAREILDSLHDVVMTESFDQASAEKSLGLLHTLKGSARMVGKAEIAQTVHEIESEVRGLSDISFSHDRIRSGYQTIQSQLQRAFDEKLLTASTDATIQPPVLPENNAGGLQVSDTAFDSLLNMATDLTVNHASLSEELAAIREAYQVMGATVKRWQTMPKFIGRPEYSDLDEIMADLDAARLTMRTALRQAEREQQKVSRTSASLQQSLIRTRLVRVDELHDRLTRTVQDACAVSGVSANLVFEGGELTLDRTLFKQLAAPLDHIVRNAVVHGIEPAEQRARAGKSPVGKLTLNASVDGTDLVIRFYDDGRGIDRESLNALAVKRGHDTVETHEEMQRLLFSSGFSSVDTANELAGHGLGLAAVKVVAEQLGGRVLLSTEAGSGTIVTLRLPQRMVINQVVLVDCQGLLYAIPVGYVVSVLVEGSENVSPDEFATATIDSLLASSSQQGQQISGGPMATVLVKVRGRQLAVKVDQVIGYRELVTQPLGPQISSLNQFIGGSVLPDGRQVLILDLVQLLDSSESNAAPNIRPASESLRPVALIVDDSRTMRVAIERVLQQCGIAVRLASDGVEALESVDTALPNLVIVDLEMPRLDGMSLLDQLSSKYGKACPPLIIISSRDDAQNRQRAQSLGVVRFLNKPFTENALLEAIEAAGMRIPDLTIA